MSPRMPILKPIMRILSAPGKKASPRCWRKNTQVPKRKYSHFQLLLDSTNTLLVTANGKLPLTLGTTSFELHDWLPDEKKPWNVLVITVDGTKVVQSADGTSATLPAAAIAMHMEDATGAITGKLIPISPTAHVEALWSGTKISLNSDTPSAQDGTFTIKNLPDGAYT